MNRIQELIEKLEEDLINEVCHLDPSHDGLQIFFSPKFTDIANQFRNSIISECQALIQGKADEAEAKYRELAQSDMRGKANIYADRVSIYPDCIGILNQLKQDQA